MPVNVNQQTIVFLVCFSVGIISGIIFDFFNAVEKKLHFKSGLFFISDILLWLIILGIFFFGIYIADGGVLRWYIFLGAGMGGIFYILSVRLYVVKIITKMVIFLEKIIRFLLVPIRKLCGVFKVFKNFMQNIRKKNAIFVKKNIEKIKQIRILLNKV